jgi:hypothetical protein
MSDDIIQTICPPLATGTPAPAPKAPTPPPVVATCSNYDCRVDPGGTCEGHIQLYQKTHPGVKCDDAIAAVSAECQDKTTCGAPSDTPCCQGCDASLCSPANPSPPPGPSGGSDCWDKTRFPFAHKGNCSKTEANACINTKANAMIQCGAVNCGPGYAHCDPRKRS